MNITVSKICTRFITIILPAAGLTLASITAGCSKESADPRGGGGEGGTYDWATGTGGATTSGPSTGSGYVFPTVDCTSIAPAGAEYAPCCPDLGLDACTVG